MPVFRPGLLPILCIGAFCGLFWIFLQGDPCSAATPIDLSKMGSTGDKQARWHKLADGLEFGDFPATGGDYRITALRIDPEFFDFVLCNESLEGGGPVTLQEWVARKNLSAAINASMYLPDNRTSTGYMRAGEHVNNGRIMERFGAFFVAGPRRPDIPRAAIIDRDDPAWREKLEDYEIVVQNYRMTNSNRKILWSAGGPLYAISAVAQDDQGRILFLHSRKPLEAYTFVQEVLHLPFDARTIMYVEGGGQAGMVVNHGGLKRDMSGLHAPSLLVTGNLRAALPNVLGIMPRAKAPGDVGAGGK